MIEFEDIPFHGIAEIKNENYYFELFKDKPNEGKLSELLNYITTKIGPGTNRFIYLIFCRGSTRDFNDFDFGSFDNSNFDPILLSPFKSSPYASPNPTPQSKKQRKRGGNKTKKKQDNKQKKKKQHKKKKTNKEKR